MSYSDSMNAHGRMNDHSGLGTFMGYKNMKAGVSRGSQRVPLAHKATFRATARNTREFMRVDRSTLILNATGTSGKMDHFMLLDGHVCSLLHSRGDFRVVGVERSGHGGDDPDTEILLSDYYHHREWDILTGKPGKQRLVTLDMEDSAVDIYGKCTAAGSSAGQRSVGIVHSNARSRCYVT